MFLFLDYFLQPIVIEHLRVLLLNLVRFLAVAPDSSAEDIEEATSLAEYLTSKVRPRIITLKIARSWGLRDGRSARSPCDSTKTCR